MEKKRVKSIVGKYMFPTEGTSYMGGLENRPVIAKSEGRTVWDTDGKAYLDFQSGQMGAALGHQHPRMVKRITATMESLMHSSNTMLNVPRLRLHEKLGKILPRPWRSRSFWFRAAIPSKRRSILRERRQAVSISLVSTRGFTALPVTSPVRFPSTGTVENMRRWPRTQVPF